MNFHSGCRESCDQFGGKLVLTLHELDMECRGPLSLAFRQWRADLNPAQRGLAGWVGACLDTTRFNWPG